MTSNISPDRSRRGPSAEAVWKHAVTDQGVPFLEIPDAASPTVTYAVAQHYRVVRDGAGQPRLSLTFVLDELPPPGEKDIVPLIRAASMAMTVGPAALSTATAPGERLPLYARSATVSLLGPDRTVLATAAASGTGITAGLAATFDRPTALAFWSALQGGDEPLVLTTEIGYRAVLSGVRCRVRGRWADLHDVLVGADFANVYGGRSVDEQLRALFDHGVHEGLIDAEPAEAASGCYRDFAATGRFLLFSAGEPRQRPSEWLTFDVTSEAAATDVDQSLQLETPLHEVLEGCLDQGTDQIVHIIALDPSSGRTVAPRRGTSRTARGVRGGRDQPALEPAGMMVDRSGALVSTKATLALSRPGDAALGPQLARAGREPFLVGVHAAVLDTAPELTGEVVANETADLPVLGDAAGWVFEGRTGGALWFAPTFEVIRPAPNETHLTSPFVFSFRRSGVTADGQPGIDATATFSLRPVLGSDAAAALAGQTARGIPAEQLQVALDVPFRDEAGVTQRQRLAAEVSWDGDVLTARVRLLDNWARLVYGALSQPGFQTEPARLQISWVFPAWRQIPIPDVVLWGNKFDGTPIIVQPELAVQLVALKVPVPSALEQRLPPQPVVRQVRRPKEPIENDDPFPFPRPRPLPLPRPVPIPQSRWVRTTVARAQVVDVLFPCAELGACYVEERAEGPVAIGCADALRLGQAPWRQYELVPSLQHDAYRVYRSLQQPGRFLVQPVRFCLSRHRPGLPRAYQPTILLYSLLDPAVPGNNKVIIDATLQPDIEAPVWDALVRRLRDLAADPVVDLMTDVEGEESFSWTLPLPAVTINAQAVPGGLAVSLRSDLTDALLLRNILLESGIIGQLTLSLPDGTRLDSTVELSLLRVAGPLRDGPIEVTVAGTEATLVNRIERDVDVSALHLDRSGSPSNLPVEHTLAPAAKVLVDLGAAGAPTPSAADCRPVYTVGAPEPIRLTEIRSFVEDISMSVLFLDLIDHASRGVAGIELTTQLVGASAVQSVPLTAAIPDGPRSGTAHFVLPLTRYLERREITYQVTVVRTDGSSVAGPTQTWNIGVQGAVVGIAWAATGLP